MKIKQQKPRRKGQVSLQPCDSETFCHFKKTLTKKNLKAQQKWKEKKNKKKEKELKSNAALHRWWVKYPKHFSYCTPKRGGGV